MIDFNKLPKSLNEMVTSSLQSRAPYVPPVNQASPIGGQTGVPPTVGGNPYQIGIDWLPDWLKYQNNPRVPSPNSPNAPTVNYTSELTPNPPPPPPVPDLFSTPTGYRNQAPWTDWGDANIANLAGNQWLRSSDWKAHQIWNPYWGYQDFPTIAKMYQQYGADTPLRQWQGLTRSNVFPGYKQAEEPSPSPGSPGYGGDTVLSPAPSAPSNPWTWGPDNGAPGAITGEFPTVNPQVPYPSQWGTASNVFENFARGMPSTVPPEWEKASNVAQQMASSGLPVSTDPYYLLRKQQAENQIKQAGDTAAEQYGLGGLRHSTALGQQLGDIASRAMTNFGVDVTGQELAAQEAARQRQLSGVSALTGLGQGIANLGENAMNRGLAGAQGLQGLGSLYAQYPMDLAKQAMNMGLQMQAAQQQSIAPLLQEFLRTTPEASPWLQYAMGVTQLPFQTAPNQYQSSPFGNMMNAISPLAMLAMLGI